MNSIKGKKMQRKIMVMAMGALLTVNAFAQAQVQPQAQTSVNTATANDPSQRVVLRNNTPAVNTTAPVQAANPYGSVQTQGTGNINYDPNSANINGKEMLVPNERLNQNGNIPNPNQAQMGQMGVPNQPPNGLPQDSNIVTSASRGGQIDPVEATINMLNTPNGRIKQLSQDLYNKGQAINTPPVNAPKSENGVLTASLSPGAISPVVRTFKNRTSTIMITDMTGQPWPILNYDGLNEDFTVKRIDAPAPDGYMLSVTPNGTMVSGNLTLVLKSPTGGYPVSLVVDIVSAQKTVDVKTEIRVQAKGPNTQFTSINAPDGIDTNLLSLLQGVAPAGAKELKVSTNAAQAWLARDGKMYLRTRYKVLSPAFENVTSSPDGTYAYKMVPVPVVLYKSADSRFGELNIEGF